MNAIETRNLIKTYNGVNVVNGIDLNIPAGSIYGFLGPNGAGKTTTIKMITGMIKPSDGAINILGNQIKFGSSRALLNIGFLPDVPEYYNWMNANEFLMFCGGLIGIEKHILKKRVEGLLELTGLKDTEKRIKTYSRGMKQRLGIAQALINRPSVIILDEPTSALDPIGRKEILDIVARLRENATVLFSTHILSDVERICDRIAVINKGSLILENTVTELKSNFSKPKLKIKMDIKENNRAIKIFNETDWVQNIKETDGNLVITTKNLKDAYLGIPQILSQNNIGLIEMTKVESSLEDIFIKAVG